MRYLLNADTGFLLISRKQLCPLHFGITQTTVGITRIIHRKPWNRLRFIHLCRNLRQSAASHWQISGRKGLRYLSVLACIQYTAAVRCRREIAAHISVQYVRCIGLTKCTQIVRNAAVLVRIQRICRARVALRQRKPL